MSMWIPIVVVFVGIFLALLITSAVRNHRVTRRPGYLIGPQDRERLP